MEKNNRRTRLECVTVREGVVGRFRNDKPSLAKQRFWTSSVSPLLKKKKLKLVSSKMVKRV